MIAAEDLLSLNRLGIAGKTGRTVHCGAIELSIFQWYHIIIMFTAVEK